MNLQTKLQELKAMHEQGLISDEVYADQQNALLSQELNSPTCPQSSPTTKIGSSTKTHTSTWKSVAILLALVVGGIWTASKFGSRDTKDTVNQFVAHTGVGTQIIPWSDRAETAARKLIEKNDILVAKAIQGITHPTGKDPILTRTSISKLDERIIVELTVAWNGGIIGKLYETVVVWEIDKSNHLGAKVITDSALTDVSAKNREVLDNFFRTKVYPPFYSDVSGG